MKTYLLNVMRLVFVAATAIAATSCASSDNRDGQEARHSSMEDFAGAWSGVRQIKEGRYASREFVNVEFNIGEDGRLYFRNLSRTASGETPVAAEVSGKSVSVKWDAMFGEMRFSGELTGAGEMDALLSEELFAAGRMASVRLRKDNPQSAKYLLPRVDEANRPVRRYSYSPPAPAKEWPVGDARDEAIDVSRLERLAEKILNSESRDAPNRTDSILILRNGRLVFEEYFWGQDREQPHAISSDTKSLTSILFGLASDEGFVDVDQKAISYFQDYPDAVWVKNDYPIVLGDLLSMQANIEWNESLPYQDPGNTAVGLINADDPIEYVLNRPLAGAPGAKYQYNSGQPNLIGDILRRAIGEPLEAFAERKLFSVLGIKTYQWSRQKNGEILTAGGFRMRPIDAAKLGQLMLDEGAWNGERVLSRDWVDRSTRQQTSADDYAYGYYWHIGDVRNNMFAPWTGFMARGQGGQFIIIIPEANAVIVVNSSNWQPGGRAVAFDEVVVPYILPAIKPQ